MAKAGGSTTGSSLPGGPEVSFAEPIWVAFWCAGVLNRWTGKKTVEHTREALHQFFRGTPDRPVYRMETKSSHYGQCNVVSVFGVGTHEYGLQIKGQEFIPFGYLEGGGGQKRDLLPCRGGLASSCCLPARLAIRHKTRPTHPPYGGRGGQGLCELSFLSRLRGSCSQCPPARLSRGGPRKLSSTSMHLTMPL